VPALHRDGEVFILNLGETENRFHPDWLAEVQEHLDTVENAEGPRALVTTASGKYFSNGLGSRLGREELWTGSLST